MSISKKLIVTLNDDVATPNEKVYIYRGDVGVDIIIELENFNYKIDSISKKNMINLILSPLIISTSSLYFLTNPCGFLK